MGAINQLVDPGEQCFFSFDAVPAHTSIIELKDTLGGLVAPNKLNHLRREFMDCHAGYECFFNFSLLYNLSHYLSLFLACALMFALFVVSNLHLLMTFNPSRRYVLKNTGSFPIFINQDLPSVTMAARGMHIPLKGLTPEGLALFRLSPSDVCFSDSTSAGVWGPVIAGNGTQIVFNIPSQGSNCCGPYCNLAGGPGRCIKVTTNCGNIVRELRGIPSVPLLSSILMTCVYGVPGQAAYDNLERSVTGRLELCWKSPQQWVS